MQFKLLQKLEGTKPENLQLRKKIKVSVDWVVGRAAALNMSRLAFF